MTPSEQSYFSELLDNAQYALKKSDKALAVSVHNEMDGFVADMSGEEQTKLDRMMVRLRELAFEGV